MKKCVLTISIVLLLCINISSCYAEAFTIHAGVQFYDSRAEIKAKETLPLKSEDKSYVRFLGRVAGYNSTYIYYMLDNNDKVNDVFYFFTDYDDKSGKDAEAVYNDLYKALINKYGEPVPTDNYIYTILPGTRMSFIFNQIEVNEKPETKYKSSITYQDAVWIIPGEPYNTKIDLILLCLNDVWSCAIDYHPYTDAQLEKELILLDEAYKQKKEEQQNDL